MRWAYLRDMMPKTPKVVATALQPASRLKRIIFSGSKNMGFGAKEAPAVCSMPWSTGKMDKYPVPDSRPWSNMDCKLRKTWGLRSDWTKIRSMKSEPGRCKSEVEMVLD